jgi:adenosylmethionine-8-amino-7-oxononanoate aminotransferase
MTRFWHGFADMHTVKDSEIVFRSGEGVVIRDTQGREYLDATAALWYCDVGFGRTEIAAAAAAQMERLVAYSSFGRYTTEPTVELAERLSTLAPIDDSVVFLTSGGSDSVDTAAKLARRFWQVMGRPERRVIVSREHGYHGMHAWGTALSGIPGNKAGYAGEIIEEVVTVGVHDTESLGGLFERRGHEIAAFIGEPVIGAGGVIPPEPHYWGEVARLCREHDILLIADEVVTGFGRTGEWWGSGRYSIPADMVIFAKGVTSGYVPLGGLLVGPRVADPFWTTPTPDAVFRHGYTYSGHATACAAALANLDIMEREHLVERVRELEPMFDREVRRLASAPLVSEIRTVGLTGAVELSAEARAADPGVVEKVVARAWSHGVATRVLRGVALHLSPAFVITEQQIRALVDGLAEALADVARA